MPVGISFVMSGGARVVTERRMVRGPVRPEWWHGKEDKRDDLVEPEG